MRFDGMTVLVTGGSRGIGRAIVKYLVDEHARVGILDVEQAAGDDAVAEYGDRVRFERADVSNERQVARAVAAIAKWGERLDGVVNNAAIADPEVGPTEQLATATWQAFVGVNLTGAFLVAKHAIPHLRAVRGAIVNIASTRAYQSEPQTVAYATTKGGLVAMTHALAVELGPDIRVNCISPGWIATDSYAPRAERKPVKLARKQHAQHPVGRVGRPEDIAALVAYLLSDEAGFVTGQDFVVDGGMSRKMIYV